MLDLFSDSLVALELPDVLEDVAIYAQSASATARLKGSLPETDLELIKEVLEDTLQMKEAILTGNSLAFHGLVPLSGVFDKLRGIITLLEPEETLAIRELLNLTDGVKNKLENLDERLEKIKSRGDRLHSLHVLRSTLRKALDENGAVRPDASPELIRIHKEIVNQRTRINKRLEAMIRNRDLSRVVQEDYVTLRNDRYVILLRPEFKAELNGIVHDHSRSGASVYVEPFEVVEENNRMASLADEQRDAILKVYRWLTDEIRKETDQLEENFEILTELDSIQAKAEYAIRLDCHAPELVPSGFSILAGRHPLLMAAKDVDVVPMNITMDADTEATIISGPNMGGKTVALKIAGLFPLMAGCGLLLPAKEGSKIQAFHNVMVDIGDEQNIKGKRSSFSGHITRIKEILEQAAAHDLVLLDELGGFTDPDEGSALAMAIIDELKSKGVRVVVTTHLSQLKAYALSTSYTKNVSVEFHPVTLKPTFRLLYDLPGDSHAIATAESLGLPRHLIERAKNYIDQTSGGNASLMSNMRDKLAALDLSLQENEALRENLRREVEKNLQIRDHLTEQLGKEAHDLIKQAESELNSLLQSIKTGKTKSGKESHQKINEVKTRLVEELRIPLTKPRPTWEKGSIVDIRSLGKKGVIISSPDSGRIEVQVGTIKVRANPEDLVLVKKPDDKKKPSKKTIIGVESRLSTSIWEVNVIGMRVDEALPIVEKAIDSAILDGLTSLRIIHGKGTGRLRQAIMEYLSTHGLVLNNRTGLLAEGGSGVTIVDLRPE